MNVFMGNLSQPIPLLISIASTVSNESIQYLLVDGRAKLDVHSIRPERLQLFFITELYRIVNH